MFKVLLVDDEPLVVEGLLELVHWNEYGFKVSGVAYDGETALECIKDLEPDLVITDIRMPGMSGIELIKRYYDEIDGPTRFMLLTGYSEFDYIKFAINIGAVSYLLKPIDADEIHEKISQVYDELTKEELVSERIHSKIEQLTKMTLERVFNQMRKPTVVGRCKFLLDWQEDDGYIYGGLACLGDNDLDDYIDLLKGSVSEDLRFVALDHEDMTLQHKLFTLIGHRDALEDFIQQSSKQSGLKTLKENHLVFHMSQVQSDFNDAYKVGETLRESLRLVFYHVRKFQLIEMDSQYLSNDLSVFDPKIIMEAIETLDQAAMTHKIYEIFIKVRQAHIDPELLKYGYDNLIEKMNKRYNMDYDGGLLNMNLMDFNAFKTLVEKAVNYYYMKLESMKTNSIIVDLEKYMLENIDKDLRLKHVSELFGYNSVYLGQLFQKHLGVKYNQYVLEKRMIKAKELLLYTNDNIKTIAMNVGFNSPDYFVQKFKEIEGISPSKYRKWEA